MTQGVDEEGGFTLTRSPSHLLHRAQQMAAEHFSSLFNDPDLTLRQFAVLAALAERTDLTQTDLVRATGIDRSTLADMVGRMEKRHLVARERSASDKRAKLVRLTNRGRAKLLEAAPHAMAADQMLMAALPKPRRQTFLDVLGLLAAAADAAAEEALSNNKIEKKQKVKKPKEAKKPGRSADKVKAKAKAKPKERAKRKKAR
jgi:DNA-binding MarR family transcriptional regulator